MDEKYDRQALPLSGRGAGEFEGVATGAITRCRVDHQGKIRHESEGGAPLFSGAEVSVVAAENAEQVKEVDKEVVNVQIQGNGRADIVGFTAVDDAAGIKQNQPRHNKNGRG